MYNTQTIHDSSISLFILCCRPLSLSLSLSLFFFFWGGRVKMMWNHVLPYLCIATPLVSMVNVSYVELLKILLELANNEPVYIKIYSISVFGQSILLKNVLGHTNVNRFIILVLLFRRIYTLWYNIGGNLRGISNLSEPKLYMIYHYNYKILYVFVNRKS